MSTRIHSVYCTYIHNEYIAHEYVHWMMLSEFNWNIIVCSYYIPKLCIDDEPMKLRQIVSILQYHFINNYMFILLRLGTVLV